jgi:hypothetical protein
MCPRCNLAVRKSEDPLYAWCWHCGEIPVCEPLPYVHSQVRQGKPDRRDVDATTCMDCGTAIESRSKRCLECSRKVYTRA